MDEVLAVKTTFKALRSCFVRTKTGPAWRHLRQRIEQAPRLSDTQRATLLTDCDTGRWNCEAGQRSDKEWLALLMLIQDEQLRNKAASIVWWDHAANRKGSLVFPLVVAYNVKLPDDPVALYPVLLALGYPEKQARRRCTMPKTRYTPTPRPVRAVAA